MLLCFSLQIRLLFASIKITYLLTYFSRGHSRGKSHRTPKSCNVSHTAQNRNKLKTILWLVCSKMHAPPHICYLAISPDKVNSAKTTFKSFDPFLSDFLSDHVNEIYNEIKEDIKYHLHFLAVICCVL